jgi:hypothetical protein
MAQTGPIPVSLTRRDFEDFAVFAALEGPFAGAVFFRRLQILLLPVAACLLVLLVAFNLDLSVLGGDALGNLSPWVRWTVLALAAAVAAIWIELPRVVRVWVRRSIALPQYDNLLQPVQLSLSDAGVTSDNASGAVVTPWQAVKAVSVVNAAIYAFIAPFQAIIIPRRAFSNAAAFNDFVAELSSYQAQAGSDWKLSKAVTLPRRIAVASVIGVIVALVSVGACLSYLGTTKAFYIATFDEHLQRVPVEAAIMRSDPGLHDKVVRATSEAFATGGWDASSDALYALMGDKRSEITWTYVFNADDQFLPPLWSTYRDVGKALAGDPAACRSYLNGRGSAPPDLPGVKLATTQKAAAYKAGIANLANGKGPGIPSDQVGWPLYDRAMAIGVPYSADEWNFIAQKARDTRDTPDAVACAARIKFFDKVLSLPDHDAAQLIRWYWATPIVRKLTSSILPGK